MLMLMLMLTEEEGEDGISEGNNAGTGTGTGAAGDVTADAIKLANNSNTSAAPSSPWPVINLVDTNASAEWPAGDTANNSGANANSAAANKAGGAVSKDANAKSGALVSSTPTSGACASDSTVGNGVTTQGQTWLLLEYCDKGCLQEAIDRGWLRTERSALAGGPNMLAVVATAMEVACALAYLHSNNVVHGDLSSWNVMLCSSGARADVGGRNFIAKVGDFGLARTLEVRSRIQTRTYGTLTHMPPETLKSGIVSKAVDVYAMGVLLWQMYTSSRPWSGLTHSQIIMLVTGGSKLVFPDDTPSAYKVRCAAPRCAALMTVNADKWHTQLHALALDVLCAV